MDAINDNARRYVRLGAIALAITFAALAILLVPLWINAILPLGFARRATIAFLLTLFYAHWALLIISIVGMLISIRMLKNVRRGEANRTRWLRRLALSLSCLITLLFLEGGAFAWRTWSHRPPTLPTFEDKAPKLREDFTTKDDRAALNVVVIGGSSAHGDPYDKWLSIGALVAWKLQDALPDRKVNLEVLAEPGASLEIMHNKLKNMIRKPDLMIIYAGHNEFQARFSWKKVVPYYNDEFPPIPSRRVLIDKASRVSPLSGLIEETLEKYRLSISPPPPVNARELIDHPMCSPEEADRLASDFEKRLDMIVSYCERIGCLPVLVIPPGNDGRYDPDRSIAAAKSSKSERAAFTKRFKEILALESVDSAKAIAEYKEILVDQPIVSEAHYRLALLLEKAGRFDEAREHYVAARDHDGMPMRCTTPFADAFRVVAKKYGVPLVDGPSVFRKLAPHGILEDHLFHDAHHPSLHGHIALAQAVLDRLKTRDAFAWPKTAGKPTLDAESVARRFGLNAESFAHVCDRAANFYERTAPLRYDSRERLAKQRAYLDAARKIRAGKTPEETGIPGLGVHAKFGDEEVLPRHMASPKE